MLLTLPDDQPGHTVLARKRRTTSHLAGHGLAGTPVGTSDGQAGRGGAGVVRKREAGAVASRDRVRGPALRGGRGHGKGGLRVHGMRGLLRMAASLRGRHHGGSAVPVSAGAG